MDTRVPETEDRHDSDGFYAQFEGAVKTTLETAYTKVALWEEREATEMRRPSQYVCVICCSVAKTWHFAPVVPCFGGGPVALLDFMTILEFP